jgi:hypothetical protein
MGEMTISARSRSRFGLSLPLLFGLLVYAATVVRTKQILADPDTYWHITLGNWMFAHRAVPHYDYWSFTKAGAPFIPIEWLGEMVIAGIWDVFGWPGLVAAAALSVAGAMALLVRFLLRHLLPIHAAIATALSWNMLLGHTLARPLIFSFPILVLWTEVLVVAREKDRAPTYWLAPLMTLWASACSWAPRRHWPARTGPPGFVRRASGQCFAFWYWRRLSSTRSGFGAWCSP